MKNIMPLLHLIQIHAYVMQYGQEYCLQSYMDVVYVKKLTSMTSNFAVLYNLCKWVNDLNLTEGLIAG